MRKGQIEVIRKARADTMLEFRAVGTTVSTLIHPNMEDGVRLHLVDAHKARKAAKKEERRFYAAKSGNSPHWYILDRDDEERIIASCMSPKSAEADARSFAKLLNKRNRRMGATDGD